ncbi:FAD-dependent monooxygenase [Cupriavidus basilensis]
MGAALANLLGRYGIRVLAIDRATEIFAKPRAIALDNEALRILQLVGVAEGEFATVAIPKVQYRSPLFGRFARINSASIVDGHPMLVTFYAAGAGSCAAQEAVGIPHRGSPPSVPNSSPSSMMATMFTPY